MGISVIGGHYVPEDVMSSVVFGPAGCICTWCIFNYICFGICINGLWFRVIWNFFLSPFSKFWCSGIYLFVVSYETICSRIFVRSTARWGSIFTRAFYLAMDESAGFRWFVLSCFVLCCPCFVLCCPSRYSVLFYCLIICSCGLSYLPWIILGNLDIFPLPIFKILVFWHISWSFDLRHTAGCQWSWLCACNWKPVIC